MLQKLSNLIEVKKMIAISLIATFIVLAVRRIISGESFQNIFLIIIGFYCGQSTARNTNK